MKNWQLLVLAALLAACSDQADERAEVVDVDFSANAARWVSEEFQPSTLSEAEQLAELAWYTEASADLRGLSINVVSET